MSTYRLDLERGSVIIMPYQSSESDDDEDLRSICFSDADEGSCYSAFYSTAGGSYDEVDDVSESRRDSSASDCSVYVDIQREEDVVKVLLDDDDADDEEEVGDELPECRICHLSLGIGIGVIELGCDCKNDLALAHSTCAERWFKIRGNRICEICNSTAENVNVVSELELMQHSTVINASTVITASLAPPSPIETTRSLEPPTSADRTRRSSCRGHRVLNVLLACMVFAFVMSWLFHFNVSS